MAYHCLVKFGGHSYASSKDMFLVYHVIKQDHTIKRSGYYNNSSPLR